MAKKSEKDEPRRLEAHLVVGEVGSRLGVIPLERLILHDPNPYMLDYCLAVFHAAVHRCDTRQAIFALAPENRSGMLSFKSHGTLSEPGFAVERPAAPANKQACSPRSDLKRA